MENEIKWKIHDFEGKGQITTTYKTTLSCHFRLYICQDGKSKLECWIYLTNENIEKVIEIYRRSSRNIVKGLFEGTDNNKGKIKIKKIYLDILKSRSHTSNGLHNPEKYFIKKDLIDKFFQIHSYYKFQINDYNSSQFLNQVLITEFTCGITSNIDIQYNSIIHNKEITTRWNLMNFMMGAPDSNSTVDFLKRINIKIKNHSIDFVSIEDYNNVISQSSINKNADVTAYAEIVTTVKDIKNIEKIFKDTCILISFANCNWITPFSKSIYQDGRLIMMTFYKITSYPFNRSRYLIKNENLDKFLLKSFPPYCKLVKDFRLHKVIEYYISAITNSIAQERFLIGYVALECLCNNISEFAKKKWKNYYSTIH